MTLHWPTIFATAHLHSWPSASLSIQNTKPPGGRNIFQEDKDEIMKAAKQYGYEIVSPKGAKVVSLINRQLTNAEGVV